MKIELLQEEYSLLLPLLKDHISEYYSEIRHTMTSSYKDHLKRKKQQLINLYYTLESTETGSILLTPEQTRNFIDFLQNQLHDMPSEIWHTDNSEWRSKLKSRKRMFACLLKKAEGELLN